MRQLFNLAFKRGYMDKNPHNWIVLQEETWPDIDPLSFEERALFLDCVPMQWKRYFIVAFDIGMRPSDLYEVRHTFASLTLQAGEDPSWIARMMGHSNTRMLFERYAKRIRNRTKQDGGAYMQALKGGN